MHGNLSFIVNPIKDRDVGVVFAPCDFELSVDAITVSILKFT